MQLSPKSIPKHSKKRRFQNEKAIQKQPPTIARRGVIGAAGLAFSLFGLPSTAHAHEIDVTDETISQPIKPDDKQFIKRAFEMRDIAIDKGDQAYGAVIVRDGRIIGQSWSRVILDQDPTAHAEISAIRDATMRLNSRHLNGAVMYSSSQPCPMCEAAAYWAGVNELIFGQASQSGGSPKLCR